MTIPATLSSSAEALLAWYDREARDLPWRRTRDPYAIWVAEIMLQQTRVETVLPYYQRFLVRFPTVQDLAAAPLDEVLARWSGLGYYRRARLLHRAAVQVAGIGEIPRTAAELEKLSGIGPYTAAAIASIAFGEAVAVLDGNVERVAARWTAYDQAPRTAAGKRFLRQAAACLLDPVRPGDSNQALMELGATICLPRNPLCARCPLEAECSARAAGRPEAYPVPAEKRRPVREERVAVLVEEDGRFLLFRRGEDEELMAGLWEAPWVKREVGVSSAIERVELELRNRYGGRWSLGEPQGSVRHGVTFRSLRVEVRRGTVETSGNVAEGAPEAGWFSLREIEEIPTSSLLKKVLGRAASRAAC